VAEWTPTLPMICATSLWTRRAAPLLIWPRSISTEEEITASEAGSIMSGPSRALPSALGISFNPMLTKEELPSVQQT